MLMRRCSSDVEPSWFWMHTSAAWRKSVSRRPRRRARRAAAPLRRFGRFDRAICCPSRAHARGRLRRLRARYQSMIFSVSSVEIYAPCQKKPASGSLLPGGRNACRRCRASSRRRSGRESWGCRLWRRRGTRMRQGKIRLDQAGDHVHRRPLRREQQMGCDGARLFAASDAKRRLDLALTVSIRSPARPRHDDVGQKCRRCIRRRAATLSECLLASPASRAVP